MGRGVTATIVHTRRSIIDTFSPGLQTKGNQGGKGTVGTRSGSSTHAFLDGNPQVGRAGSVQSGSVHKRFVRTDQLVPVWKRLPTYR